MASTYYTTTQYSGYIGSVVTTTSSTPRYHTQSFTSVSGSTAATKQILYCQAMVCGKPSNVSTPTVRVRQYKNGSSTATYTNLSSSTSSSISCNFSSINMSSLPSGGYAYAKINNGSTQYTSGTVTISQGDTITIYLDRTANNGNAGVYLYRDKGAAIVDSNSMAGNVGETSDMPDYHEWGNSLTYTWDSANAPYDFMTVNITFENESSGYLNCVIKLVQAWNKNSTYLETYDGTDYYSYDRVEFAMASTSTANDTIFIKNIFIVNLTAKFGAGNEPTKAWCDENLQFNASNNTISYLSNELVPIARQIKGLYVGIGNVAKQAKKAYIGINGIAKLWYSLGWTWEKHNIDTTTVYVEVVGSTTYITRSSSFYVGSTYSFNSSTGQFTVNQTTQIAVSSTGSTNSYFKYYITLTGTSGSQTGSTVYKITNCSYSRSNLYLTIQAIGSQSQTQQGMGSLIGTVTDADITTYPINGPQDGYWYVLTGLPSVTYTGSYNSNVVKMDDEYYLLLELTSSGTLSLSEETTADVWICGGGGGGGSVNGAGGSGGYAASSNNATFQSLTVTIGAAGNGGYSSNCTAGGNSSVSGGVSLSANGGAKGYYQYQIPTSGTGGGASGDNTLGGSNGDGVAKTPFGSSYFSYPYCDGGGGGASYDSSRYNGGAGGTNGGNGGARSSGGINGGAGGGHYGGKGGDATSSGYNGSAATGYGSGGGAGGWKSGYDGVGANGYQGVCFIRIPL